MSSPANDPLGNLDVLVVGAGFGGIYQLVQYRKLGFNVKAFEAGNDLGGIWYWNCYPGARTDTEAPLYEFAFEELWKDWNWTERFPGVAELRSYFQYVEQKWDVKKDVYFNNRVVGATWLTENHRWRVTTDNGLVAYPRFLSLCMGFAAIPYIPPFKGLDTFKGLCHHTSKWPQHGLDVTGKRVGVIGTGASGVQVIQEIGPQVGHLTVFQRTPNMSLPMSQRKMDGDTQRRLKSSVYPTIYRRRIQTWTGTTWGAYPKEFFSVSPEERRLHLEDVFYRGSFRFLGENFIDAFTNQAANDEVYEFWKEKVRARVKDPDRQEILAPTIPPHPIGTKRPSLESTYFEVFNQPNVDLIDLNKNAISEITPDGIRTEDGVHHQLDVLILATGFDSLTGGFTNIDMRGVDGKTIAESWRGGVHTNLGMTVSNFPNMFFVYGPHGPTSFCNGPSCAEFQGNWIIDCIQYMKSNHFTCIEATQEAEQSWNALVDKCYARGLFYKAKSWYNGGNIPGKVVQPLFFAGGLPTFLRICREKAEAGYEGFKLSSLDKS
ncbi:cyclohexanone monooxygenase [Moniliophthora roreri]|uniref:Cyclohexanone monooxygenase n=1 Tax=Moniliophthora roreri TaxID=221103 RepID=A0A0W0FTV1_MONRR|nr:cyclohexanone monooxygenase [Moniliophthora roreri]